MRARNAVCPILPNEEWMFCFGKSSRACCPIEKSDDAADCNEGKEASKAHALSVSATLSFAETGLLVAVLKVDFQQFLTPLHPACL